jgi:SpoIID/LytB domain protein
MRNRLIAVVAMSLLTVFPAAAVNAAEPSIDFNGAGWGHGVGMSQYGANARAADGQKYDKILTDYYTGATIGTLGTDVVDPGLIFTNVASDITLTLLKVSNGPASPRTGMVFTRVTGEAVPPTATLFSGDTIAVRDETAGPGQPGGCVMTLTISGAVTEWGPGTCDLSAELASNGAAVEHLVSATNCRRPTQCTYGQGAALHLVDNGSDQRTVDDCIGSCDFGLEYQGFDLVVETTLDEYTRGVAEVPFSWPVDALKTQAVAARSFAASLVVATDHREAGCFCDLNNSSSFQVYAGWVGGMVLSNEWFDAADETAGEIMKHDAAPDSDIVRAYYSSSNGGASEWVKEKWGADLPYLVSVPDPWSLWAPNPRRDWTFTRTGSAVIDAFWGTSSDYTLAGAEVVAHNESGSAKTVRFTAEKPDGSPVTKDVSGASVAAKFGLYSWYFSIDDSRVNDSPPPPGTGEATSVGVQDPRSGIWTLRNANGSIDDFYFGNPKDIPFIGDWNGNGIDTVGLYRESAGFLFLRHTNTQGVADVDIYYGNPGDLPVAGDWNGDGIDTVGIYRPSQSRFYLRNTNTQGNADVDLAFGQKGDVPIAGDWNGDGFDTVGVYRPSTRMVYFTNSLTSSGADFSYHYLGASPGDRIVAGDWNLDGVDTVGVFRPSNATFYLRDTFTQTNANIVIELGASWMNPVVGYWGQ